MIRKICFSLIMCAISLMAMAQHQVVTHVVQRGETIESIAKQYNVSVADINKANPNAEGVVYVGMKLAIPVGTTKTATEANTKEQSQNSSNPREITSKGQVKQNANSIAQQNKEGTEVNGKAFPNNSFYYGEGSSFSFLYQSDAKLYGLQMELGTNLFCLTTSIISNMKFGKNDTLAGTACLGAGVRRKLVFGDNFLIQGKIYPYIGFAQSDTPKNIETGQEAEDKTEFTYGASADISLGIKLWNTTKGNSTFLHIGYAVMAGEFETKGLFKSGFIMVGLTTILK